jgi:DNA-binding NarL/FixJ family response regulator
MNPPEGRANGKSRILVVDDHPLVREGLADLVNDQSDLCVCGEAASIAEAQAAIRTQTPDLVLLDLRLGPGDGLEAIKGLRAQFPDLRILVVSQFDESVYAERALRAGALGYIMKERATAEVLRAIRIALAGGTYASPEIGMMALTRLLEDDPVVDQLDLGSLTQRELQVFESLGAGKSSLQIAAELALSVKTVETHRDHLKFKLGLATGAELARLATQVARKKTASVGVPARGRRADKEQAAGTFTLPLAAMSRARSAPAQPVADTSLLSGPARAAKPFNQAIVAD